jgi:hypothetical protein
VHTPGRPLGRGRGWSRSLIPSSTQPHVLEMGPCLLAGDSGKRGPAPDIPANGTKVSAKTLRNSGQDNQDKFSLPTCFGFSEDILKAGARRFVTDVEFDRSGSKCFSRDEMKCQSSLSWRQAKVRPQPINGLISADQRPPLGRTKHCTVSASMNR